MKEVGLDSDIHEGTFQANMVLSKKLLGGTLPCKYNPV